MCFSTTSLISGLTLFPSTSLCPNGQSSQSGPGSGVNCSTAISGCEHGTHVAGIAAGFQSSSLSGIASGAMTLQFQTSTSARLILPSGRIVGITRYRF